MDLTPLQHRIASHASRLPLAESAASAPATRLTASERVLAAELQGRGDSSDALSMMVSSIARMVQAGKTSDSRWKAS